MGSFGRFSHRKLVTHPRKSLYFWVITSNVFHTKNRITAIGFSMLYFQFFRKRFLVLGIIFFTDSGEQSQSLEMSRLGMGLELELELELKLELKSELGSELEVGSEWNRPHSILCLI